jgi:hypothetical protein
LLLSLTTFHRGLVVFPFVLFVNPPALELVSLADNAFKLLLLMAFICSNF